MGYIGSFPEEKMSCWKLSIWIVIGCALLFWINGCQHFKDTVGCYTHTDMELGYAHQFGDPGGGGISGVLAPEHGNFGESSFRIDRPDQYAEDRIESKVTLRFAPGSCK